MLFVTLLVVLTILSVSFSVNGFTFSQSTRFNRVIKMAAEQPWFPDSVTTNTVAFDALK